MVRARVAQLWADGDMIMSALNRRSLRVTTSNAFAQHYSTIVRSFVSDITTIDVKNVPGKNEKKTLKNVKNVARIKNV